jgi:predicted  nucleic acid-binding Zn-ribbon protein
MPKAASITQRPPRQEHPEEPEALSPQLTDELLEAVEAVPAQVMAALRHAAQAAANAKIAAASNAASRTAATAAFTLALATAGIGVVPFNDENTGTMTLAYLREDEIITVDVQALREGLYEYNVMVLKEEEDLAIIHANDLLEEILKPEAVEVSKFKLMAAANRIPPEVVAACATLSKKAGYIAFSKP